MKLFFKKSAAVLMAMILAFSGIVPSIATAEVNASEGNVCSVNGVGYTSLKEAFENATNGSTVVLEKDITNFKTSDIVNIPEDKTVIFDMAKKSITVDATDFKGRVFVNKGNLTVTGDGVIDLTNAKENGYGPIENFGTLTVENGSYKALKETNAVGIWNRAGGTAYFKGGTYEGFPTAIRTAYGSETTISGGRYINDAYSVVDNDGNMTITGGYFKNTSCSSCAPQWGYAVRNGMAGEDSHLVMDEATEGSITVIGVQGALSNNCGLLEVKGGSYETIPCETHGGKTAHYALYVAGGSGESKAVVTGGTFKSASKTAALIGNDTPGDGGINAKATTEIRGGTFIAPEGVAAITGAPKTGNPFIIGGTFKSGDKASDVTSFVPSGMEQNSNGEVIAKGDAAAVIGDAVYATLADAIKDVKAGETITLIRDVTDAEGIAVDEGKEFTVDFNNKTYTVVGPGAGSTNTETNAFQLLKNSTITFKNGTINVAENANGKDVRRIIQNYANLTLEDMVIETANLGADEDYALSFNNGNIVFKGNTSIVTSSPEIVAFDIYKFDPYPGVNVTFDDSFTGAITGRIIYDSSDATTHTLTIKGNGEFAGIDVEKGKEDAAKTGITVHSGHFGESVADYVSDELNAELKKVKGDYPYSYFKSVDEAIKNAEAGDVVTDLDAVAENPDEIFVIELDFGYDNKVITLNGSSVTLTEPQREGYKFLGWFVGDKEYKLGEVTVTEDTRFVAKWEKIEEPTVPQPEDPDQGKPDQGKPDGQGDSGNQGTTNGQGNTDANANGNGQSTPTTSDSTSVAFYGAIMLLAGLALVVLCKKSSAK